MSDKIPITFTHSSITFDAYFTPVTGAGGTSVWHLYSLTNFYLGQLTLINHTFSFHGAKSEHKLEELSQFFGDYVRAWIS